MNTSHRRQSETIILSTIVDLRSLEIEFLIAVCRQTVNFFLVALVSDCFCYVFSRPIVKKKTSESGNRKCQIYRRLGSRIARDRAFACRLSPD